MNHFPFFLFLEFLKEFSKFEHLLSDIPIIFSVQVPKVWFWFLYRLLWLLSPWLCWLVLPKPGWDAHRSQDSENRGRLRLLQERKTSRRLGLRFENPRNSASTSLTGFREPIKSVTKNGTMGTWQGCTLSPWVGRSGKSYPTLRTKTDTESLRKFLPSFLSLSLSPFPTTLFPFHVVENKDWDIWL